MLQNVTKIEVFKAFLLQLLLQVFNCLFLKKVDTLGE